MSPSLTAALAGLCSGDIDAILAKMPEFGVMRVMDGEHDDPDAEPGMAKADADR